MSTQNPNNPNKKGGQSKSSAVDEISRGKNNYQLYTRTASEQDAALLVANSTGRYSKTPDFTAVSKVDPRYLGIDEYSEYLLQARLSVKISCDEKGKMKIQDLQLVEENPKLAEQKFGRKVLNDGEKGVTGTDDLRVYSNNSKEYINGTFRGTVNINAGSYAKTDIFGNVKFTTPAKQKINIQVNIDDLTRDYNIMSGERHRDFITNSMEGRPVEIDKKISEIFTFYTRDQYDMYTKVQKSSNNSFRAFERDSLPKDMSFYEAQLLAQDSVKYLVMDTKLFQATGNKYADEQNHLRNLGSEQAEALKEYQNQKFELYLEYKKAFLKDKTELMANGSDIMEVKKATMYVAEQITNDSNFIRECAALEEKVMAKLNPALKKEIETKIQQLESVPNYNESSAIKFDLNNRLEKLELNQKYAEAVNAWSNFKPTPTEEIIKNNTNDKGKVNPERVIGQTFEEMGFNDYYKVKQMSKEELIIRWENLNTKMVQLIPTTESRSPVDEKRMTEIENISTAMSLLKDVIISHPDNQKAFYVNPYSTGEVDKLSLDLTTYYAIKKLQSIEGLDKNRILESIPVEDLTSRAQCEKIQQLLREDTKNFALNIKGVVVNYEKLMESEDVKKEISTLAMNSKIYSPQEMQLEIASLAESLRKKEDKEINSAYNSKSQNKAEDLKAIKGKQEILENAIRNEIAINIISTHIHSGDFKLDLNKHMDFITTNNKTKIMEAMQTHHEAVLEIFNTKNPTSSMNPKIYEDTISEIKSFLATKCNITNEELERLSPPGGIDFFKTNDFYQMIQNPRQGEAISFERLVGMQDLKTDLQDPQKCYEADKKLTEELQKLSGIGQEEKEFYMRNDGRRTLIEQYQTFLREHISENRQEQYLERKQMAQVDYEIYQKPNYVGETKSLLLNSNILSQEFRNNMDDPYSLIRELKTLENNNQKNSHEYEMLSKAIDKPYVQFSMNNEIIKILEEAQNKEKLIDYIAENWREAKVTNKEVMRLVEGFKNDTGIDFTNNKELVKSLQEIPFDEHKLLSNFKIEYNKAVNEGKFMHMETFQSEFLETIQDKAIKNSYKDLFKDKESVLQFVTAEQPVITLDITKEAQNPLYCIAKIKELETTDPLGMKTEVLSDVKSYVDKQSALIEDKVIEIATRHNIETAPALDMEIFKQTVQNNGIEARTIAVQNLIERRTDIVNDKPVENCYINEERRQYCQDRLGKLERNFATDEDVKSITTKELVARDSLSKTEYDKKCRELFKDNFGCVYGFTQIREEHLVNATTNIKKDIDKLQEIHTDMQKYGIRPSANTSFYKEDFDSTQSKLTSAMTVPENKQRFEAVSSTDKEVLDTISTEKNIRAQIIEVDRALKFNPYSEKHPDKDALHEKMTNMQKEIAEKEQYLAELKDTNFSFSNLRKNIKSFIEHKGNKALLNNNNEILQIENDIKSMHEKYADMKKDYDNSKTTIDTLKAELKAENDRMMTQYKDTCETLGINSGYLLALQSEQKRHSTRGQQKDDNSMPQITDSLVRNITKLEKGEITLMDLPNKDLLMFKEVVTAVKEERLNDGTIPPHKLININIAQDIAESATTCRQINEYILLREYKETLTSLLNNKNTITDQEYSQVIISNYGYAHTTSANVESLNSIYKDCEQSFKEVSNCRRLLQNIDESMTSGKVSQETIFTAISELDKAIQRHNQNVQKADEKFEADSDLKKNINAQILSEAGISYDTREKILQKYVDKENSIPDIEGVEKPKIKMVFGQDIFKEHMNKIEFQSVLTEIENDNLKEKINLYEREEVYKEELKKVIYGNTASADNQNQNQNQNANQNQNSNQNSNTNQNAAQNQNANNQAGLGHAI